MYVGRFTYNNGTIEQKCVYILYVTLRNDSGCVCMYVYKIQTVRVYDVSQGACAAGLDMVVSGTNPGKYSLPFFFGSTSGGRCDFICALLLLILLNTL